MAAIIGFDLFEEALGCGTHTCGTMLVLFIMQRNDGPTKPPTHRYKDGTYMEDALITFAIHSCPPPPPCI